MKGLQILDQLFFIRVLFPEQFHNKLLELNNKYLSSNIDPKFNVSEINSIIPVLIVQIEPINIHLYLEKTHHFSKIKHI